MKILFVLALAASASAQITVIQGSDTVSSSRTVINNNFANLNNGKAGLSSNNVFTGINDFRGAPKFYPRVGTTSAITGSACGIGEVAFSTNATAGQNWYFCAATNTWTQQLNSGGGGGGPTVAGTSNQITVTGAGCTGAGTCTVSLPSVLTLPGTINKLTLTARLPLQR